MRWIAAFLIGLAILMLILAAPMGTQADSPLPTPSPYRPTLGPDPTWLAAQTPAAVEATMEAPRLTGRGEFPIYRVYLPALGG